MLSSDLRTLAIIVNYQSAAFTLDAVQSVLSSDVSGSVRVVVVDNSEDDREAAQLRAYLPPSVKLLVNGKNVGFGRACNQIYAGDKSDAVLLINPDARLLPGSLKRLQKTLFSEKKVGAAGPQLFWDESLKYYFPPPCPPALLIFQSLFSCRGLSRIMGVFDILWRRYAIGLFHAKSPVPVKSLSGGLVLLKREALKAAGGLFDPRFFLYYEDTDLFLRLRKSGSKLLLDTGARAFHYYDQCGNEKKDIKSNFMRVSMNLFLEKHRYAWKKSRVQRWVDLLGPDRTENFPWVDRFQGPFCVEVPRTVSETWLFEWSPNPNFMPAALYFGSGLEMEFSRKFWNMLSPGLYYGRIGDIRSVVRPACRFMWEKK